MSELVKITIENNIADVRFNRPEKYNALSFDMIDAMAGAISRLETEPGVRVVVISGEGKSFCAGLDVENFAALQSGENKFPDLTDRYQNRISNIYQHIGYGWKELPVPVIAAIHGNALGGGFQIAMGADIRFSTPDAKFSLMEMKWGLIPDMSVTQTIRDIVSIDVAKELIFTGKIIKGEEAARLNLVTHICEKPYDDAMTLAREIASKNPDAVRAAKKLINEVWHGDSGRGLMMESELMMTLMGSPNQLEAVTAAFTKLPPKFKDPV
ncbi:MAG: crotonase/enoyl-CoA hydratase family protein [Deltaproteobacteria bacterium]